MKSCCETLLQHYLMTRLIRKLTAPPGQHLLAALLLTRLRVVFLFCFVLFFPHYRTSQNLWKKSAMNSSFENKKGLVCWGRMLCLRDQWKSLGSHSSLLPTWNAKTERLYHSPGPCFLFPLALLTPTGRILMPVEDFFPTEAKIFLMQHQWKSFTGCHAAEFGRICDSRCAVWSLQRCLQYQVFQHHRVTWAIPLVWLLLSTPVMPPSVACLQGDKSSSRLPPGGLSHPRASCLYFCSGKCFFSKISAGAGQSWEACWALSLPAGSRGRSRMPGSSRLQGADAGGSKQEPWRNALHPGFTGAE